MLFCLVCVGICGYSKQEVILFSVQLGVHQPCDCEMWGELLYVTYTYLTHHAVNQLIIMVTNQNRLNAYFRFII